MARRGYLAELQHQLKLEARELERQTQQQQKAHERAIRDAEKARKAEERAAAQLSRANAAEQKRLAKVAREAHIVAMEAEAERRNTELLKSYEEIDSILEATLDVDDFVDLDSLRIVVEHPPFEMVELKVPIDATVPVADPPRPTFSPPPPPTGLGVFVGQKRHKIKVAAATAAHEQGLAAWQMKIRENHSARMAAAADHAKMEAHRIASLKAEQARYDDQCFRREIDGAEHNKSIDELIANLGYGDVDAVQEYVSIVLSNSVYPDEFSIRHEFEFEAAAAELRLRVLVPGPGDVPTTKAFKYTKSTDEISTASLSQKACKDRYASAVAQVALRSIHEIFEADRRGIIRTIALEVGTETIDPATGRESYVLFVAVGAEREVFMALNLANVVPNATLVHLGAAVSKNPFGLVATEASGIRGS